MACSTKTSDRRWQHCRWAQSVSKGEFTKRVHRLVREKYTHFVKFVRKYKFFYMYVRLLVNNNYVLHESDLYFPSEFRPDFCSFVRCHIMRFVCLVLSNKLFSDQRDQKSLGISCFLVSKRCFFVPSQKNGIWNRSQPTTLRMGTWDGTGLGPGNLIKFCFFEIFSIFFFWNFLRKFYFFGEKYFSNRNFSGGVGQGSVRAAQKHAYFRFSVHVAFCQAGFCAALDFGQPVARRLQIRAQLGHNSVTRRPQVVDALKSGGRFFLYNHAHSCPREKTTNE